MSITFIGHVSKDINIVMENSKIINKTKIPGGGVFFGSIAAATLNDEVNVITKVSEKDKQLFSDLEKNQVKVKWIYSKKSTSIENIYPSGDPDHRVSRMLSKADSFTIKDFENLNNKIIHISPLWHGEFSEDLIPVIRKKTEVLGLDAQGFLRNVNEDGKMNYSDWSLKNKYLPLVDIFKVDIKEAYILTKEKDPKRALNMIKDYGVKEIILTHNKGIFLMVNNSIYEAFFGNYKMEGRTGRGDTCVAAYLVAREKMNYNNALKFAAEITTKKMQYKGPYRG
ncbi:Sugar or nucleoside kinase, ribokinase family [Marinitoga hydrogenitolerans DSM 16785]|uniref:Sugar or nucleoside kinase, ribokinase family n=1 Tax=Marinitoga hydrogenitolerans (strain DSM 16785 / JCM 12826 / AT1271) TaxID=1122195 RepID=A0A1M4SIV4_MARH1|nr:PfkB family carbohydrate kinase [Marinitoga hydrogenitolerans]SHE32140.1 Sugar or nucleoside kinase, ribokinase family [Marinitoga hydrogenitolerans DSM 16785]